MTRVNCAHASGEFRLSGEDDLIGLQTVRSTNFLTSSSSQTDAIEFQLIPADHDRLDPDVVWFNPGQ